MEPLQHGPDGQEGYLKDQGMRTFLRRFAQRCRPLMPMVLSSSDVRLDNSQILRVLKGFK